MLVVIVILMVMRLALAMKQTGDGNGDCNGDADRAEQHLASGLSSAMTPDLLETRSSRCILSAPLPKDGRKAKKPGKKTSNRRESSEVGHHWKHPKPSPNPQQQAPGSGLPSGTSSPAGMGNASATARIRLRDAVGASWGRVYGLSLAEGLSRYA